MKFAEVSVTVRGVACILYPPGLSMHPSIYQDFEDLPLHLGDLRTETTSPQAAGRRILRGMSVIYG
jgi:hypothetical protein